MSTDIIEMWWGCATCNQANLGRTKTCKNCGAPRTDKCKEWMPDDVSPMAAVKDVNLLNKFEAGEDWKCIYCGASEFRADGCCAKCGSPQQDSTKEISSYAQEVIEVSDNKSHRNIIIAVVTGLFLIIACYFIFREKIVDVKTASVQWTYQISIDRYSIYQHQGWDPSFNSFNVQNLGSRIHHYDHLPVGSHSESYSAEEPCGEKCHTTARHCRSNKNGSATCYGGDQVCSTKYCSVIHHREVVDYRDFPRFRDWYSWDDWEWGHNRNVVSSGNDINTNWPTPDQEHLNFGLADKEQEREDGRTESYSVNLVADDKTYSYVPKSLGEFKKFGIGTQHKIKTNMVGSIEILQ